MKLTIKPHNNYIMYLCIFASTTVCLILDFILIGALLNNDLKFSIIVLCTELGVYLFFLLWYILYPRKYVIDDEYITEYYFKETIFKLKRENLVKIYIRKARWWDCFAFVLYASVNSEEDVHPGTNIYFVYTNHELLESYRTNFRQGKLYKKISEPIYLEHLETMTLRRCLKICKFLNIEPIYI